MLPAVSPVAITGMGVVSAAGVSCKETLATLDLGQSRVGLPSFATEHAFPVFQCPLSTQKLLPYAAKLSRTVGLALHAAKEALSSAGLFADEFPFLRAGVIIGTSVGASLDFLDCYKTYASGATPPLADIRQYLTSNPAMALARLLHCTGPVQTVVNACSSGADAIGLGASWIRLGLCDIVLAGGADSLSPISYAGFSSLRLPSRNACRPFDVRRNGLSLGEGAAFMLLESKRSVHMRATRAQAFIAGYGTAADAHHLTSPHPNGRGLAVAVEQAFAQANATWDDIAFINAHGTATETNDATESAFFLRHCPSTPFIATKGCTGHTLGAAGAMECVFTAAHLTRGLLPPTPGFAEPDPRLGVAPVRVSTPVRGPLAMTQSLAFGGNNSVLLVARGTA